MEQLLLLWITLVFNYVAQPGDECVNLLPPLLGVYDKYAIKWGYAPIAVESPEAERPILNQWIQESKMIRCIIMDLSSFLCFRL